MSKTTVKRAKVIGVVAPERLYTKEGAMRYAGMGRSSLLEAVSAGVVKPKYKNGRAYYRGSELIAWIES